MLDRTLSKAEAERIFSEKAVMIGSQDVIPIAETIKLFGNKAVEYAKRDDSRDTITWNVHSTPFGDLEYMYFRGFVLAATYNNIRLICNKPKKSRGRGKIMLVK